MQAKQGSALFLIALVSVLALGVSPPAAGSPTPDRRQLSPADARIAKQQEALLDPQSDDGSNPALTDPHSAHNAGQNTTTSATPDSNARLSTSAVLAPEVGGTWKYITGIPTDFYAMHTIVGPGGKILLIAGSGNSVTAFEAKSFTSYVCTPAFGRCKLVKTPVDLFCAGHVLLPDGRALVGGGSTSYKPFKGERALYAFNFATETYQSLTRLEIGRWYPTLITAINGKTLITGGLDGAGANSSRSELFDYRTNTHKILPGSRKFPLYPRIQLTSKINYFFNGVGYGGATGSYAPGFWDPFNGNTFTPVSGLRNPNDRSSAASCFVGDVRNQNMLVMGGGSPALATTDKIKLSAAKPVYTAGPTMKAAKMYHSCVTLPDGTLLEAGGGSGNKIELASTEVSTLKSINSSWTAMNPLPTGEHRLYHSTFFLLDDGRVLSIGSNPNGQARSTTMLVYSPPSLFKGTRPAFTSVPTTIKRYSTISVGTTGGATRMTLTKPPTPTHGSDPDERYMSFPIVNNRVDLSGALKRYLPDGYYRVWAVNASGATSVAKWVRIG